MTNHWISGRSILITGGSGTLGQALTRRLLDLGARRIVVYSRGEHRQAEMRDRLGDDERMRWMIGDVRDQERLTRAMQGCHAVVHAAALKRIEVGSYDPDEMVQTNVIGTRNVIHAAHDAGVERLVGVSTDKAVAPVGVYGATKLIAEMLLTAARTTHPHGPAVAIVRYGNVAGSAGSVIPRWRAMQAQGRLPVPLTDPECTRYWMRLSEAVDLVLRALEEMPEDVLIPELPAYRLGDLAEAMGLPVRLIGLPAHEKRHETMDGITTSEQAQRLTVAELRDLLADVP